MTDSPEMPGPGYDAQTRPTGQPGTVNRTHPYGSAERITVARTPPDYAERAESNHASTNHASTTAGGRPMTEPTTKTGKQLHYWLTTSKGGRGLRHDLISRIERESAQQERERLRATMAKWDGDDWASQPQNERIAMLLDHYEDPLADPEGDLAG